MEVVAAIVGSALTEPFRFLFGSICAMIKNLFKIHSNCNDLERDITSVLDLKRRLENGLEDYQLQDLLTQVQDWLTRVGELENNFQSVRSSVMASGITSDASCCARSLHCKLSNNIVRQIEKAKQLIEVGNQFESMIAHDNPVPRPVQYIEGPSIIGEPTAASTNLDKLMDLVKDDKHKKIGVWGMGGVGKTTLVKNLNNHLSEHPTDLPFSIKIFVVVSQNASVRG